VFSDKGFTLHTVRENRGPFTVLNLNYITLKILSNDILGEKALA